MKKIFLILAIVFIARLAGAQSAPWKAFNNFHALVSETLHPVITGKVQPVKDSSAVLLASAKAWQASQVPAGVNAATFQANIAELVKQCGVLNDEVVAKQQDSVLKGQAVKVHNTFHALLEACKLKD